MDGDLCGFHATKEQAEDDLPPFYLRDKDDGVSPVAVLRIDQPEELLKQMVDAYFLKWEAGYSGNDCMRYALEQHGILPGKLRAKRKARKSTRSA